ncbi:MAG: SLC26A/SulP transporter family protein [Leptolyngbyaceae cyanobacterium]
MQSFAQLPAWSSLWQRLQQWRQPEVAIASLSAGLVTGVIAVIRAISYASLIFSGTLSTSLSTGLGLTVFSTAVTLGVVAIASGLPGMIATPLAAPTAVLAILASNLAADLQGADAAIVLTTVIAAIALSTLLTGALLFLLGILRQGDRIRFVPYPVIGGFMAGTGWLLTKGFVQITTDQALTLSLLQTCLRPEILWQWLPGVGFSLALLWTTRRWQQFWTMPATLLVCAAIFFSGLWVAHMSLVEARAAGLLLGPFPQGEQLWQPLGWSDLSDIQWGAIAQQSGSILTVMFVTVLSLLLSNSSIELVVGRDLNLSREMTAVGLANLTAGVGSGMVGTHALPSTLLVHDLSATYRLTGLIAVLPAIAVLGVGSTFLAYLPKAVLGSLILYLGLSLLWQWLYQAYFKLPLSDYLTVWATLILIDAVGFIAGITVGFVLTVVLFMYDYSQVDVAKRTLSGATSRSNTLGRTSAQAAVLSQQGGQIFALELQGFLFFGTANYLLNKVRDRVAQSPMVTSEASPPLRYAVIDFRQVTGLDSSAVLTFSKILRLARQQDFTLVLTNLRPAFETALMRGQGLDFECDRCQTFPDLDRALAWCEQQILQQSPVTTTSPASLPDQLAEQFLTGEQATQFMTYLEVRDLPAGCSLFTADESAALYFIESGQVDVLLNLGDDQTKRLQTCASGQLLGEMRFYGKVPLSDSVVTKTQSRLYALTRSAYEDMQTAAPELVQALQRHIVELLCDSLNRRGEQLRVMQ